jgi:hypothetical protein
VAIDLDSKDAVTTGWRTTSYWTSSRTSKATVATIEKERVKEKNIHRNRQDPQAELVSDQDQLWRGVLVRKNDWLISKESSDDVCKVKIFKRLKTSSRIEIAYQSSPSLQHPLASTIRRMTLK